MTGTSSKLDLTKVERNAVLLINGQRYQVVQNTSCFFDKDKQELEMVLEMYRKGEDYLMPRFRLFYVREHPDKALRFKEWTPEGEHELELDSVELIG